MLPHLYPRQLLPSKCKHFESMQNFAGMLEYLQSWVWTSETSVVQSSYTDAALTFSINALPMLIDADGSVVHVGSRQTEGAPVFPSDGDAFRYMVASATRDLQYRGIRDERTSCFEAKQEANFLLYRRVCKCESDAEYEALRQSWDAVNRPKYKDHTWSPEQRQAIDLIKSGISHEDEESRIQSRRWLYVQGPPGSGKSAVLLTAALNACSNGMSVLIVCPTGYLVHQYKSKLPDKDGVENVRVDTIQGVLQYRRKGADSQVTWAPPSALRRIDLILVDEASQYEDQEWTRFFQVVREQPHMPFTAVVADFRQLQPVVAGGQCQRHCKCMQTVELKTVYRSSDEAHLVFLNRIRMLQPTREILESYFEDRQWKHMSMEAAVARGMALAEDAGTPFSWLTCTNAGASEVCAAALKVVGVSTAALAGGYACDPNSKSELRIVARTGIVIRLTRNFDKQRGFVNGAVAVVCESLRGNEVFTARLLGTGNMVLLHPMTEGGIRFLPCCYGYATTIRRAQGADMHHGCLYFENKRRPAARGYAYVGCSRFKSRGGCYLYGKMRRSDFLPVGAEKEDEVLERGYDSLDSDDDEGCGLEYVGGSTAFDDLEEDADAGMVDIDFMY